MLDSHLLTEVVVHAEVFLVMLWRSNRSLDITIVRQYDLKTIWRLTAQVKHLDPEFWEQSKILFTIRG